MPLDLSWLSRDKTAGLGRLCGGRSFQPSIDVIDLVLSQNYSMDESGLGRGTGSRRQRIEPLRWTQFARRAQLALADHVHEFDTGEGYRS